MSVTPESIIRRRLDVRGQVQGVGFRPFVYRLARRCQLGGCVANNSNGALIEIEGPRAAVDGFERSLRDELPPLARISGLLRSEMKPRGEDTFHIDHSQHDAARRPEVTPDAAVCRDCLRELLDAGDRRYRYPFINCTNCGPRYSIICTVPYDRPATTMADFTMCPDCQGEYDDPLDRRFHAQPNACPACGPRLRLTYPDRTAVAGDALAQTVRLLRAGKIVAVKGIGGYHLACRADLEDPVARLRTRKLRDGKPLALMVANVAAARRLCRLSDADVETLSSVVAPIVLAPKRAGHRIAASVAPGCRDFGLMLPYAPLHHLLFAEGLEPLVMTSANLAGQPLTYDDDDAYAVLGDVADAFLTHDRRIFRPIDDSVVFTFRSHAVPLRRARGYAPRPLRLELRVSESAPRSRRILALGGELKSTVCLVRENEATLSEHLGDLTRPDTYRHFVRAIARLRELFDFEPEVVAHDLHPRYLATKYAQELALPVLPVQHHHAHVASVMAEWGEAGPLIGLACDGTGYGTDGAVWGCEVLLCARGRFERVGHLEYFPLVGADRAALETWRPAGALLHAALGDQWRTLLGKLAEQSHLPEALSAGQLDVFAQQLASGLNAPPTSSLGRVFDAVGFLLGLCVLNRHEAEAAMALEGAAGRERGEAFRYEVRQAGSEMHLSVVPTIADIVDAVRSGDRRELIAARFHETIARMLLEAAVRGCELHGVCTVSLSGGCFANRRLLSRVTELLEQRRVRVLYHRQVPCGDGGVALGQAVVAAWQAVESAASPSVMEITP